MDKVIVLTVGKYECEYIVGIFSSIEKVEEFKKIFPNESFNEPKIYNIDHIPNINKYIYYVVKFNKEILKKRLIAWNPLNIIKNHYGVNEESKTVYNTILIGKIYYNIYDEPYTYITASSKEEAVDEFEKLLADKK